MVHVCHVYRPFYLSEVDDFINIITVFAWHTGLAREATGIDDQKKQFQQTSLNKVQVMNNICSIENR